MFKMKLDSFIRLAMFILSCFPDGIPLPDIQVRDMGERLKGAFAVDVCSDHPQGHIFVNSRFCGNVEGIITVFLVELARYFVWYDGYMYRDDPDKDGGELKFEEVYPLLGLIEDGRGGYQCVSIDWYLTEVLGIGEDR